MSVRTISCLCGGITGEVRGDPLYRNACHCTSCQKQTGAVFGTFVVFNNGKITIKESEPSLMKTYEDTTPESGNVLKRSFCGRCGSTVKVQVDGLSSTSVAVGIIDGDKETFRPQTEFFCRNRPDWISAVEGANEFTTMPPMSL